MNEFDLIDKMEKTIRYRPTGQIITITGQELHDFDITPPGTPRTQPGELSFIEKVHRFCRRPGIGLRQ
jgi:hypothetical protein